MCLFQGFGYAGSPLAFGLLGFRCLVLKFLSFSACGGSLISGCQFCGRPGASMMTHLERGIILAAPGRPGGHGANGWHTSGSSVGFG